MKLPIKNAHLAHLSKRNHTLERIHMNKSRLNLSQIKQLILICAISSFSTQAIADCTVFLRSQQNALKSDDYNRINQVKLVQVHAVVSGLSENDLLSALKFMAPKLRDELGGTQTEIWFHASRDANSSHVMYVAYTPQHDKLSFRDGVWDGMSLVDGTSDFWIDDQRMAGVPPIDRCK